MLFIIMLLGWRLLDVEKPIRLAIRISSQTRVDETSLVKIAAENAQVELEIDLLISCLISNRIGGGGSASSAIQSSPSFPTQTIKTGSRTPLG